MLPASSTNSKSTARGATFHAAACPKCGVAANESLRYCPTCGIDLGCPNVRAAAAPAEVNALSARFTVAHDNAGKRGLATQFDGLVAAIDSESHVVVAMPFLHARTLIADSRTLYASYDRLVGQGSRAPAPFKNDSDRLGVSGKFFASFGSEIRYGVLSLNGVGLKSYGLAFLTLRDVAIEERVSFLHENSYLFLDDLGLTVRDEIPTGFRSSWQNRAELVAAKIEPMLTAGSNLLDWARLLVVQGATRKDDSCVEAHIFGNFNVDSIQSIEFAAPGATRYEKSDIACIKELMAKRKPVGGTP